MIYDTHLSLDEKVNRKLIEIGNMGKFQWFAFYSIVLGMNATGFFFYQLGYLLQVPVYTCDYTTSDHNPDLCTPKNICDNNPLISNP